MQYRKKNIAKHLLESGFKQYFKDYETPATESFIKKIYNSEIEVEFLTTSNVRVNKDKNVEISGVIAQPLSYLTLSLENTIAFSTFSNENGVVVSPGAWMFHKGATFVKRTSQPKQYKDLYGIWYVATQLGDFSDVSACELKLLAQKSPKWFRTFQKNLTHWIENAVSLDWMKLESQDPFGALKKTSFERTVQKLTTLS